MIIGTDIRKVISDSLSYKPKKLRISELKWRYLMRSALRGKNILLVGPTGCGKTLAAMSVVEALSETVTEIVDEETLHKLQIDCNVKIIAAEEIL